jgi:hypothetical protein
VITDINAASRPTSDPPAPQHVERVGDQPRVELGGPVHIEHVGDVHLWIDVDDYGKSAPRARDPRVEQP